MTPHELEQIEALIKKHKPDTSDWGLPTLLLLMAFLGGCFKGCGY